ncbi:hypothetical protein P692DRAFT_20547156 [Suillus brevipes Sb2]|nr:hypothetical protein P692DRAFT_20547156 [Suillus brevipes Sb2]
MRTSTAVFDDRNFPVCSESQWRRTHCHPHPYQTRTSRDAQAIADFATPTQSNRPTWSSPGPGGRSHCPTTVRRGRARNRAEI